MRIIKRIPVLSVMLAFCVFVLIFNVHGENREMVDLNVELDRSYGRCRVRWEEPAGYEGRLDYRVILLAVSEDGSESPKTVEHSASPFFQADDYIAYICQEEGFPFLMRIRVEGSLDGEKAAEGVSEKFDPRDVFPEKEVLEFGTDIPMETVRSVSLFSSGMAAEDNWDITVSHFGDEYTLYYSGASVRDSERRLKEKDWEQLMSILKKGNMIRKQVMDPSIEVLDGGSSGIEVSWKDEKSENAPTYYRFNADDSVREELSAWLSSKSKDGFLKWVLPAAGLLAVLTVIALLIRITAGGGSGKYSVPVTEESLSMDVRVHSAGTAEDVLNRKEEETVSHLSGTEIRLPALSDEDRILLEQVGYTGTHWYDPNQGAAETGYVLRYVDKGNKSYGILVRINKDGSEAWASEIEGFFPNGFTVVSDGVVVFGDEWIGESTSVAYLAKVDRDGKLLWRRMLDNGIKAESVLQVAEDGEEYVAVSRGGLEIFCISHISEDGIQTGSRKTIVGNFGFWDLTVAPKGYLVQFGNFIQQRYAEVAWVSPDGFLLGFKQYSGDGERFYLKDMICEGNELYCSGYLVPVSRDPKGMKSNNREIDLVLDEVFGNGRWEISNEELTPLVQENYRAFLLVCDARTGQPKHFYTVPGALGRELYRDDKGDLQWFVESIADTYFSPATSSFTIGGVSIAFRFSLNNNGKIVGIEKTGEVRVYRA